MAHGSRGRAGRGCGRELGPRQARTEESSSLPTSRNGTKEGVGEERSCGVKGATTNLHSPGQVNWEHDGEGRGEAQTCTWDSIFIFLFYPHPILKGS